MQRSWCEHGDQEGEPNHRRASRPDLLAVLVRCNRTGPGHHDGQSRVSCGCSADVRERSTRLALDAHALSTCIPPPLLLVRWAIIPQHPSARSYLYSLYCDTSMFGCLVAGRLPQTNLQQIDETHAIFELHDASTINHICVFLVGDSTLLSLLVDLRHH